MSLLVPTHRERCFIVPLIIYPAPHFSPWQRSFFLLETTARAEITGVNKNLLSSLYFWPPPAPQLIQSPVSPWSCSTILTPTPHSSWSSVAPGYQDIRLAIFGQECRRTDNINNFLFLVLGYQDNWLAILGQCFSDILEIVKCFRPVK